MCLYIEGTLLSPIRVSLVGQINYDKRRNRSRATTNGIENKGESSFLGIRRGGFCGFLMMSETVKTKELRGARSGRGT